MIERGWVLIVIMFALASGGGVGYILGLLSAYRDCEQKGHNR